MIVQHFCESQCWMSINLVRLIRRREQTLNLHAMITCESQCWMRINFSWNDQKERTPLNLHVMMMLN